MSNSIGYYLIHVLPIVFVIASVCFILGTAFGWLLWGRLREQTYRIENQNDVMRGEIRRAQAAELAS